MRLMLLAAFLGFMLHLTMGCGDEDNLFVVINDCEIRPNTSCQNADLTGVDLSGFDLTSANLDGADLSNANLTQTYLIGASMNGTILTGVIWASTVCPDGSISDNNGESCGGHQEDIRGVCDIKPDVVCQGADLRDRNLSFAIMQNADLADAELCGADLTESIIDNGVFSNVTARQLRAPRAILVNLISKLDAQEPVSF